MTDRWEGTYEDDLTQKRPIEEHLQLMMTFAQEHETTLKSILTQTRNTICEASENHYRPICVAVETLERVYPQDFLYCSDIPTDEQIQYANINKVMVTFIYLQDEIHELKHIARTKFYSSIIMYGQQPSYLVQDNKHLDKHPDDTDQYHNHESVTRNSNSSFKPGEKEVMMGQFLPFLQELSNFVERCYRVCLNIVQQLGAFMNTRELIYKRVFQSTHMTSIFQSVGELLSILITLDLAIQQNDLLLDHWSYYKSMMTMIRNNVTNFGTNDATIAKFERLIVSIDQSLMIGEIYKGCIEQNFDDDSHHGPYVIKRESIRTNSLLLTELLNFLKTNLDNCLSVINSSTEHNEKDGILVSMSLYILYRQLLPSNQPPDMKLHKILWNVQKVVPFVILSNKLIWTIPEFLSTFLVYDTKKLEISNPIAFRRIFMTNFDSSLSLKTSQLVAQCNAWYIIIESKIQSSLRYEVNNILSLLDLYGSILMKGLYLSSKASYLIQTMLIMHTTMQIPLTKSACYDIAILIEHLKAIEYTFVRKHYIYSEILPHILHHLADDLVNYFKPIKIKLESLKLSAKASLVGGVDNYVKLSYILYIIILLENLLKSTDNYTPLRLTLLNYFVEIIISSSLLGNDKDMMKLKVISKRMIMLSNLTNDLRQSCDTSFLYFHYDLLTPIIQSIYTSTTEGNRLQYILTAFCDGVKLISSCRHLVSQPNDVAHQDANGRLDNFYASYRYSLKTMLMKELIMPLCHHIETDLRLHVHMKHLPHMQSYNPKFSNDDTNQQTNQVTNSSSSLPSSSQLTTTSTTGTTVTGSIGTTVLRSYATFLSISSLHILGHIVNIQDEITHHLNKTFYNLTTITLHDWKMYAEMKSLAYEKYGLKLLNNFLPMGSLDQGLDVLQIMRNIHIFVNRFNYNMNIQQFVEYRSAGSALNTNTASKHINTIKIQSIAASIRQHGLGVLNTTVNYTYQFLTQKFHIFREFLHDDHIRAHLSREHRWYRKHRHDNDVNNMYPYEHGVKFVKDIKKLGLNDNGKSYLDLFRMTITEIGNALGYVRMVRSASMYYCSEAVKYLPELDDVISFEQYAGSSSSTDHASQGANFHEECVRSGKNLDDVIKTLIKNFDAGSDYFKVLVNVFQTVLLSEENEDLKNFFMIVPSLCISWIDASLQAKDNMFKATRGIFKEMYFTDDGFAMGIAYCLAITKQTRKFEALHWVDSIRGKIRADAHQLEQQQAARAAKEARIKDAKEKAKKSFSFFGSKKAEKAEEKAVDEDYEDLEEIHTLQNTAKRLEAQRRETEQLFYSLSGAAIFFKRTDVDT